jgi:hypothetical protein
MKLHRSDPQTSSSAGSPVSAKRNSSAESEWEHILAIAHDILPFLSDIRLSVTATQVASGLGLSSTEALGRLLHKRQLPRFTLLRDWFYVVTLVQQAEGGDSLAAWAMRREEYPDVYYRFIRRVTGFSWTIVQDRGCQWAKEQAIAELLPNRGRFGLEDGIPETDSTVRKQSQTLPSHSEEDKGTVW